MASETLAEDRKRSKYERLHECFWDRQAVQCVIRQMLDERDDLSNIDPVSANRMEYFANQLIGTARGCKSVGNAAALREALVQIVALARQDQPRFAIISTAETALAALPRNCDRYPTVVEARNAFICEQCEHPCGDCTVCDDDYALCRPCGIKWLFEPAKEGGAK